MVTRPWCHLSQVCVCVCVHTSVCHVYLQAVWTSHPRKNPSTVISTHSEARVDTEEKLNMKKFCTCEERHRLLPPWWWTSGEVPSAEQLKQLRLDLNHQMSPRSSSAVITVWSEETFIYTLIKLNSSVAAEITASVVMHEIKNNVFLNQFIIWSSWDLDYTWTRWWLWKSTWKSPQRVAPYMCRTCLIKSCL